MFFDAYIKHFERSEECVAVFFLMQVFGIFYYLVFEIKISDIFIKISSN